MLLEDSMISYWDFRWLVCMLANEVFKKIKPNWSQNYKITWVEGTLKIILFPSPTLGRNICH